jgi:PAS domain S-box-containing protein
MRVSLRTKLTLATSAVVLAVVAVISVLFLAALTRQVIRQTDDRATFIANEVFLQAERALIDAKARGEGPISASPADLRAYVQRTLDLSSGWNSAVAAAQGYSPIVDEISIGDRDGLALISSYASKRDRPLERHADWSEVLHGGFAGQLRVLYGAPRVYQVTRPFKLGPQPFGEVRVSIRTALLRNEISPGLRSAGFLALSAILLSTLFAAIFSGMALAPLPRIMAQLDRISAGESDLAPVARADEFGQVSSKISNIGKQLRDVREIFSTLRENLDQLMTGLADGLLLINAQGRIVLASPSAAGFLGLRPDEIAGHRASELFPAGHPLRQALRLDGDQIEPAENVEARVETATGAHRISVSAQAVSEEGAHMGMLVTLRDLESLERIGSELQVSERLAALGRVTAGVAHEVKNPLNSMRVWLEVLKTNLPTDPESQQALKMLDSEIERLDRVVKTFLDFNCPVELEFGEIDLAALVREVLRNARPAMDSARVQLLATLPEGFPPVRVDRHLIYQALLNLVLNACEAMPRGGLLRVTVTEKGDSAEVAVADRGVGIAPENHAKIFQLFFTTRRGGTGMGLANAFRFVQLHGGSIEFDSELGRGTTFRLSLPLARTVDPAGAPVHYFKREGARET